MIGLNGISKRATLLKLGFVVQWVNLIMLCLKYVSFSVLLKGRPGASFHPTRGIRQGDPLTLYVYIGK